MAMLASAMTATKRLARLFLVRARVCEFVCVCVVRARDQKSNAELCHMLAGTNGKSKSNTSMLQ
jgi:hypothetical protein